MFFVDAEQAAKWTPDKVGIVSVPKTAIPHEALTTTGSDDWLNEVRAYSDVPSHQGTYWPEPKAPADPEKPVWKYKRDEYAPFPQGDKPNSTVLDDYLQRDKDWRTGVKQAIAEGTLHPDDARRQGFDDSRTLDRMQPLPDTLYHVTTNKTQALKQGLKTRAQLGQGSGAGLGGGDDDTISLTDNPETAKRIHDAMHEARSVVRGETKPEELLHQAAMGHGAERPWLHDLVQGGGNIDIQGAKDATERVEGPDWKSKLPPGWQAFLQGKTIQRGTQQDEVKTQGVGAMKVADIQAKGYEPVGPTWRSGDGDLLATHYHRPMTEDERLHSMMGLYKIVECPPGARRWTGGPALLLVGPEEARDHAEGGHRDPPSAPRDRRARHEDECARRVPSSQRESPPTRGCTAEDEAEGKEVRGGPHGDPRAQGGSARADPGPHPPGPPGRGVHPAA